MKNRKKKNVAIICECNPFTKGHKKIINEAKKTYNASNVILLISGNFVQRGEPACLNINKRVETCMGYSADMIIKIPVEYSLSSAKYFATACINILKKLSFIDILLFGSNINDIEKLKKYANINVETNKKKSEKSGYIYEKIYHDKLSPNDILGVEYIRAIKKYKCNIKPVCIERDMSLKNATDTRTSMKNKDIELDDFTYIIRKIIFDAKCGKIDLNEYYNISKDFSNQILKLDDDFIKNNSFTSIAKKLATKEKTLSNVKRNLLHITLDIKEKNIEKQKYGEKIDYIQVLDFNDNGKKLLKKIKIPFITSYTPLSYKSIIKNFAKQKIVNEKTLEIKNESLKNNIYADKLYNFLSIKK